MEQLGYHKFNQKGRLKIFFGYAAGVGKTYAMFDDAKEQWKNGIDVVIGYVEPDTPPETMQLLIGIPVLPRKEIRSKNHSKIEFDLDGALERKPKLIIIDNLAHSNGSGVRNKKRYQDIEELLNAGIDVYTTVNVSHIESLKDLVQDITRVYVKETVPDYIFDQADKVKLIDIEPDELLRRIEIGRSVDEGKESESSEHIFTKDSLRLLREIAMRKAADRISHNNQNEQLLANKSANIKMLVCISSSPSSARCIRWTARTADAFHAPWAAVYVENKDSDCQSDVEKRNFHANVELAEQLGAEVVTLNGSDLAVTVAQYAKLTGITNIVIGKSRKKRSLRYFFDMDLEDKLISLLSNTEIHIIPDSSLMKVYREHKKKIHQNGLSFSWADALKTMGVLFVTTMINTFLTSFDFNNDSVIMLYILSVLIISRITTGYLYGISASVISVLICNIFFTEPYFAFNIVQKGYPITFTVMLLVALITNALTVRTKVQAKFAMDREQRTEVLYEINKRLLVARGLQNIVELTSEYITRIFRRSVVFYTQDPSTGVQGSLMQAEEDVKSELLLSKEESAVAHWVFVNQKKAGAGTDTLMDAKAVYMPVISQGNVLGVLGISCANGLLLDQSSRAFVRRIVSLMAMAMERQRLSDEQRLILVETEKEKMRSNLLRAISHDLRTPLTAILGSSSAILENAETLDNETKLKLISNIKDDSQWLIRMVENLLSVTRINEDTANVTKSPEAAEEIIAAAISRIRKRFVNQNIKVSVPDELLMVPMDGTLIEQVIINLIENAIKHSGIDITIDVSLKRDKDMAVFEVSDNGDGISEQDIPYLFESYVPNGKRSADSSRGMGIGLSICMSIIKAHDGRMEAFNKKEGGAVFRFSLPI
ncbi:MAG: histidine kinase [Herbinix sp.]|jgi:two-component system sensor histidine kinase KdpD|nr:histidine kinase [Herbinix sp.]